MKSIVYATRENLHRYSGRIVTFVASAALVTLVSLAFTSVASAQTTPLTGTADFGSRGSNVTYLQQFLAANPSFYPEGLVTGYFGSLTRAAVQRFQAFYGIVSSGTAATTGYGRVGPMTLAKINSLILGGGGTTSGDISGPRLFNVATSRSSNSTSFSFNTDENTMARVVYGTSPLMFNEGDERSNGFGAIGGSSVNSGSGMSTSHSVVVPNLNANTTYYYTVIATDAAGNVSVWGPNNAIRTNQ